MDKIEIHRYTLLSRSRLNAASVRTGHAGALIRINGGHGCIHPWPELGDDALPVQLAKLQKGQQTPLIKNALLCAHYDSLCRQEKIHLLAKFPPPASHWTTSTETDSDNPFQIRSQGFNTVKLKSDGQNLKSLHAKIKPWQSEGFKIRIDFNETGNLPQILTFWESIDTTSIDFLEDPIPWDETEWQTLKSAGIPLAADIGIEIPEKADLSDYLVVKPARHSLDFPPCKTRQHIIVTSYMDHAIGQIWAAAVAGMKGITGTCGLLTHPLFESDPFFDQIQTHGPFLKPSQGYGLGFDQLLHHLPWEKL